MLIFFILSLLFVLTKTYLDNLLNWRCEKRIYSRFTYKRVNWIFLEKMYNFILNIRYFKERKKVIQRKTNLGWRSGYFQEKILFNRSWQFYCCSTKFIWIENLSYFYFSSYWSESIKAVELTINLDSGLGTH